MRRDALRVMLIVGSLNRRSATRVVVRAAAEKLERIGCGTDVLDLVDEPLGLFDPDGTRSHPDYAALGARVDRADAYVLGSPDYHGGLSGAAKNFLDHFWHEFAGKLFAPVIASHEMGLTACDQLRTFCRQSYAWALPYGVSFVDGKDVIEGKVVSDRLRERLAMMVRDIETYGALLATQRRADLLGEEPGFMARLRPSRTQGAVE